MSELFEKKTYESFAKKKKKYPYTRACCDRNFCRARGEEFRVVVSLNERSRDYAIRMEIEATLRFETMPLRRMKSSGSRCCLEEVGEAGNLHVKSRGLTVKDILIDLDHVRIISIDTLNLSQYLKSSCFLIQIKMSR